MRQLRRAAHFFLSIKARAAGIQIGSEVNMSSGGQYTIHKTAKVVLEEGVWLARNHRIEAHANSLIAIGRNVHFGETARLVAGPGASIVIGEECFFNHDLSIVALTEVVIGKKSISGPYTYISDHNHRFAHGTCIKDQGYDTQSLHIGSDVWLGVGATLVKGSSVGDGSVVAARAVVNKAIPSNEIWGGIPAKKIGGRAESARSNEDVHR
jgi:acetyltransferase-like isoleucine patch superfamily enzyme